MEDEPVLANSIGCYPVKPAEKVEFELEIDKWINEGWLQPAPTHRGPVIPLMAVAQPNKGKVRPVMDYRDVNEYVINHSGSSSVCDETVRRWRRLGDEAALLDLQRAYLQIRVHESLWKHQTVRYKGKCYHLTRLGFGLRSAPKIMKVIVEHVLALDGRIKMATDSYVDDIYVNEAVVPADEVAEHLRKYGLICKPRQELSTARVLGLQLNCPAEGVRCSGPEGTLCLRRSSP